MTCIPTAVWRQRLRFQIPTARWVAERKHRPSPPPPVLFLRRCPGHGLRLLARVTCPCDSPELTSDELGVDDMHLVGILHLRSPTSATNCLKRVDSAHESPSSGGTGNGEKIFAGHVCEFEAVSRYPGLGEIGTRRLCHPTVRVPSLPSVAIHSPLGNKSDRELPVRKAVDVDGYASWTIFLPTLVYQNQLTQYLMTGWTYFCPHPVAVDRWVDAAGDGSAVNTRRLAST